MTKAEADIAAWALDAMIDYAGDEDAAYGESDLPTIAGTVLRFPTTRSVSDILYRLEEQLPDMARQAGTQRSLRAAANLASKIREATGYTGSVWMGPEE